MSVILPTGVLTTRIAPAPFNDRFARVLGSSLTPQQVTSILANAELGYMWGQADLLDEIRERDGHLHAELQKRELRVAGAPWELTPPPGSGEAGQIVADWCTARLQEVEACDAMERSFADALCDLQGAVFQGRAGLEVLWLSDGRWFVPRTLAFLHPRRFAYTTDWKTHLWDASGTATTMDPASVATENPGPDGPFGRYPGIALDRFPRGKFIVHQPRVRGTVPTREGLGRLLVWWSTFKRFNVRDLLAYAEWAGRGLRIGKYATGDGKMGTKPATPEDQAVLLDMLEAMSSTVSVAIADTTDLDVKDAPSNNDVHDRVAKMCNDEISKATIGGTLGSDAGTHGARSLGEVHERGELMIARADARSVAATLVRDLIRPMVRFNFGMGAPVPGMVINVDPTQDLDAATKRLQAAVGMGVKVGQRDARNIMQLPDPAADDVLLTAPSRPAGLAPTT